MAVEITYHRPLRFDTSYSHTPRARGLESQTYPAATPQDGVIWQYLQDNGAQTARYVAGINYRCATSDVQLRNPLEPFFGSDTLLGSRRLTLFPKSARVHVIGGVTGPYVAGEGDWHGMLLVTRGKEPVPTFRHLTRREMHGLHRNINQTLNFLQKHHQDNTNIIGFSFSPYESRRVVTINHPHIGIIDVRHPRSPVQNLACIHAHAISMNEGNLHSGPTSSKSFDRRLTREPFLPQLTELMDQLVIKPITARYQNLALQIFQHIQKDTIYPKGIFISFSEKDFRKPESAAFIQDVHSQYEKIYWQIADAIVDIHAIHEGKVIMHPLTEARQKIATLLALPEFTELSLNTKRFLRMLAELANPNDMIHPFMDPSERAKIMEKFILLGPAYNILYYKQAGRIVTGWHPRWITGASPIESMGVFKDQQPVPTKSFLPIIERHKTIGRRLLAALH